MADSAQKADIGGWRRGVCGQPESIPGSQSLQDKQIKVKKIIMIIIIIIIIIMVLD